MCRDAPSPALQPSRSLPQLAEGSKRMGAKLMAIVAKCKTSACEAWNLARVSSRGVKNSSTALMTAPM